MMLAMAWMFAIMDGHLLPGQSAERTGMMPGMGFWFAGFVLASIFWAYRFAAERSHGAVRRWWLDSLGQTLMAVGMAIVFGAMLFRS